MSVDHTQNPEFLRWLMAEVPARSTILDIGCGSKWYHRFLKAEITSIDAWEGNQPDILLDLEVSDLPFLGRFDVVLVLDVVEHLPKDRAKVILEQAKRLGGKVIVLTPLGWDDNRTPADATGNCYQLHKSLWGADDFDGWQQVFDVRSFAPGANRDTKYVSGSYLGIWPA